MLSVSSCRTSRPRPAPSATRTANSLRREIVRESSAPARFAQVISSTSPALAISTSSGVRVSPTIASRSGTRRQRDAGVVVAGARARASAPMPASSRCAASSVDAGREAADHAEPVLTPRARSGRAARRRGRAGSRSRRRPSGPTKPRGSTPTTVRGIAVDAHRAGRRRPGRRRTAAATRRGVSIDRCAPCRRRRRSREQRAPRAGGTPSVRKNAGSAQRACHARAARRRRRRRRRAASSRSAATRANERCALARGRVTAPALSDAALERAVVEAAVDPHQAVGVARTAARRAAPTSPRRRPRRWRRCRARA